VARQDWARKTVLFALSKVKLSTVSYHCKVIKRYGKLHRFTRASVTKIASLGVVLAAISISLGFGDKERMQKLAE